MRSAGIWIGIGVAMLAVAPLRAENAHARDGGSSTSSSAGERHESGGSGGGANTSSHDGGGSSYTPSTSNQPAPSQRSDAERRHPVAGSGRGGRDGGRDGHDGGGYHRHGGYYGGGIWVDGCYDCGIYDVYPWYYPRYRYHYRYYDDSPALRVMVEPDTTRVYVDRYYAGVSDDFDGLFQRLYVSPGRHQITLKLEGYRSHSFEIYAVPGRTLKLHWNMVRGTGQDEPEDLAGAVPPEVAPPPTVNDDEDVPPPVDVDRRDIGKLSLDIRPRDASVYIDGRVSPEASRDDVPLPAGTHKLQVVRPGYRSFEQDVVIRAGKTEDLDVRLEKN